MQLIGAFNKVKSKGRAAFALPEVMVAVLVLAIIAMAFYAGLSSGFLITQAARVDLRATQIMTQKIEGLRLCSWIQLRDYTFKEAYDPLATNGQGTGVIYWGTVTTNQASVIPSGVSYKDNMRLVTVTLRWTNYNGRIPIVQTRSMETHSARNGLQSYVWGGFRQNPVFVAAAGQPPEVVP